jgi:high affinity cGMP-specific 3',5'-cyclic phosphodiesterase 9
VLENSHIASLYKLVSEQEAANVFREVETATWKDIRKMIIATILHTDMVHHFPLLSKVSLGFRV